MAVLISALCIGLLLPTVVVADPSPPDVSGLGWKYGFCWKTPNEISGKPVFSGTPYTSASMTVQTCLNYCRQSTNGGPYNYAGLQKGTDCYCGTGPAEDKAGLFDQYCKTPCGGDANANCGGSDAVSVYIYQNGRTPAFADLTYDRINYQGCYALNAVLQDDPIEYPTIDGQEFIQYCFYACAWDDDDNPRGDFHGFSTGSKYPAGSSGVSLSCYCHSKFDYGRYPTASPSLCQTPCGGDPGQYCGGDQYFVHYSNVTDKDLVNASKFTSKSLWASSITAASTSRSISRASASVSKASASASRSTARSSVAASQASASTSRSRARSTVSSSQSAASSSRSSARSRVSSSKSLASSSRSSQRSFVSVSQVSASQSRATARQSLSQSKSSALSRYTSSSLSKDSANAAFSTASSLSASSRSLARSSYTSSSRAAATSKSLASASKSLSRSSASVSRARANSSQASSRSAASSSRFENSLASSRSQYSASVSKSLAYSSLSFSAHQASLTKSSYYSSLNAAKSTKTTTTTVQARYGQVIEATTTIVIDTSSMETPDPEITSVSEQAETTEMSVEVTATA